MVEQGRIDESPIFSSAGSILPLGGIIMTEVFRQLSFIEILHKFEDIGKTQFETIFALLALTAVVLADNPPPPYRPAPAPYQPEPKYEEPAQYQYAYAVKDEYSQLDFNANEEREGYATSGSYQVLLPDGRTQTVTYSVNGDSGYVADVQYAGEAKYEPYQPKPAPKYPAPAPQYN
eukprot:maker-scaffold1514_size37881-snap-gene-0.6 protein:Tk03560 transcript:maker-scaffold1514_size37881-snap-gene-0.6-mRNA-1 annotation:"bcs-1 protein"